MVVHQSAREISRHARIVPEPVLRPNRGTRVFDLHPAVHLMVAGAWFAFVAILATAFMNAELVVPAAIFAIGVVALFVTPALWSRVVPEDGLRRPSWSEFLAEGVDCHTGRLTSGQALAQILVLPAMLLGLGLFFAVLKAFV
ncbi:MAG: hypothetical protein ACK4K7_10885 [Allosphingosinicella sp.]|uniref:hypothetical protein n=1 Tax=Allosphingosinicella sp. TaxID=2823234 RepID=UPI003935B4DE